MLADASPFVQADAMFQKALTHIDNVSDPSVWMQVGKMYDLIKNNKVGIPEPSMHPVLYQVLITCRRAGR